MIGKTRYAVFAVTGWQGSICVQYKSFEIEFEILLCSRLPKFMWDIIPYLGNHKQGEMFYFVKGRKLGGEIKFSSVAIWFFLQEIFS